MHGCIHSVELLEMALEAAARLGYNVREDRLEGFPGGACTLKGQKWLFLDPSLACRDRLAVVIEALAADAASASSDVPGPLANAITYARENLLPMRPQNRGLAPASTKQTAV